MKKYLILPLYICTISYCSNNISYETKELCATIESVDFFKARSIKTTINTASPAEQLQLLKKINFDQIKVTLLQKKITLKKNDYAHSLATNLPRTYSEWIIGGTSTLLGCRSIISYLMYGTSFNVLDVWQMIAFLMMAPHCLDYYEDLKLYLVTREITHLEHTYSELTRSKKI